MLLQLVIDSPEHLALVPQMHGIVDTVAIGNLMLKRFGVGAIATIRELCPETLILADTQTFDGGEREADMIFGAGAALMSVLSCASPATIEAVGVRAHAYGANVVLTIADVSSGQEILPADLILPAAYSYIALPSMHGAQKDWRKIGRRLSLKCGRDDGAIDAAIAAGPDILVVGSAITKADDPREIAQRIKNKLPDPGFGWPWDHRMVQ